ncbi:MAG: DinB family protein [Candidatus Thorarchaeota archaeon]
MSLLTRMSKYMLWADAKIWNYVITLTDEEFSLVVSNKSGSIYERYLHMAHGHSQWFHLWIEKEQETIELERLSRDELFSYLTGINRRIADLIHDNDVDAVKNPFRSAEIPVTLEEMIFNIINHATYHRGQIVTLFRILGKDVTMTDYVPYLLDTFENQKNE